MKKLKKETFDEETLKFIAFQVLSGLKYCHLNKVIHRDLKPENIFVNNNGYIKIGDFGDARMLVNDNEKTNKFCGSYNYFSPERIDEQEYDTKSDIWSFGVILFQLATSEHPFFNVLT